MSQHCSIVIISRGMVVLFVNRKNFRCDFICLRNIDHLSQLRIVPSLSLLNLMRLERYLYMFNGRYYSAQNGIFVGCNFFKLVYRVHRPEYRLMCLQKVFVLIVEYQPQRRLVKGTPVLLYLNLMSWWKAC